MHNKVTGPFFDLFWVLSVCPLSLNNNNHCVIYFSIPAGEKVCLVGRTGSGKSTCIKALFRLVPWETGAVRVDGIDLRQLVKANTY